MPVIRLSLARLESLLGRTLDEELLGDLVFRVKGEIESLQDDTLELEVTSDRPDLLMAEGLARAFKGLLGIEKGLPRHTVEDSGLELKVSPVPTRPYIGVAVVYDYPLDESVLEELIQFQEKLHVTVGRRRRKVAIGIHDLDKLPGKRLEYREARLDERMRPLHTGRVMTIAETLSQTEQGREYGGISIRESSHHPAIYAGGEIISLPPVINSDVTRLEPGTRNLLIDVTGTDEAAVLKTLDILTSILAERKPARIGSVGVELPGGERMRHPLLERGVVNTTLDYVNSILGTRYTAGEIVGLLETMRWGAREGEAGKIEATYPEYRVDILHPIDLVEEVAMAQGYDSLPLETPRLMMKPRRDPLEELSREASRLAAGTGSTEMHTYTLVPAWLNEEYLPPRRRPVSLVNPISAEMSHFRASMVPSLLLSLRESQGVKLPLRIHEVGTVSSIDTAGNVVETIMLGLAVMDDSVGFEDIQAPLYGLLRALGLKPSTEKRDHPGFIRGRSANLLVNSVLAGRVGEVSPAVLERLGIKYPVAVAEVDLGVVLGFL